jgi:hypothetical protein
MKIDTLHGMKLKQHGHAGPCMNDSFFARLPPIDCMTNGHALR